MFLKGSMWMLSIGVVLLTVSNAMRCDMGCAPKKKRYAIPVKHSPPPLDAGSHDAKTADQDPLQSVPDHIAMLKQMAHEEKDIVKINCLSDKEIQVKALVEIANQDAGPDKLKLVRGKVRTLAQEADACSGEKAAYVGDTQVTVAAKKEEPKLPVLLQWAGAIAAVLGGLGGLITAIAKLIEAMTKWVRRHRDKDKGDEE